MNLSKALQIKTGEVIALVGGGGKSSAMFSLGRELVSAGRRVVLTTTTRIAASQVALAPVQMVSQPETVSLPEILPQLRQNLDQYGQVLLISEVETAIGKARGVPPQLVDALAQASVCDVIINEADGAQRRAFKAPAPYEPVIPASTSLVMPVVGLDVLGKSLNETYVHRPALVCRLSDTPLGEPITIKTLAQVLTHQEGGLKSIPAGARVIPLLNKLDLASQTEAHALARLILQSEPDGRIKAVVVGAVRREEPVAWVEKRIAAIILAAGQASRFGSAKQLALWQGKPLLAYVVDAALASLAERTIVVLGAHAAACRAILKDKPVEIVFNDRWAEGQSTSMKAGLAALPASIGAGIFSLADQPMVTASVMDAVIAAYQKTLAPVVWPTFEGRRGNPVLFDRSLFAELKQVTGDTGARPVLKKHQAQAETVAVAEAGILHDVDRPQDLAGD